MIILTNFKICISIYAQFDILNLINDSLLKHERNGKLRMIYHIA